MSNSDEIIPKSRSTSQKKRKRTKNTSTQQYEVYLHVMENDYNFRSGTINPTLDDNYVDKKWEELTKTLNSIGDGPNLTADEWKKRFTDWKYALRSKYRKLAEHRRKTGSGPQSEIKLTPLEERAIGVWGKVVVTGTPYINEYDGLTSTGDSDVPRAMLTDNSASLETSIILDDSLLISEEVIPYNTNVLSNGNSSIASKNTEPSKIEICTTATGNAQQNLSNTFTENATVKRKNGARVKPLSFLAEQLLEATLQCEKNSKDLNDTLKQFSERYTEIKAQNNQIELLKLQFAIAKYKFENPDFTFDESCFVLE